MMLKNWFKSGNPWIWMTGGAVSISLIAVLGLLFLIGWRGLVYFWPHAIHEWQVADDKGQVHTLIGELHDSELVPTERLRATGLKLEGEEREVLTRYLVKTGNREYVPLDFRWVLETDIRQHTQPKELAVLERTTNGNFYGRIEQVFEQGKPVSGELHAEIDQRLARVLDLNKQIRKLQVSDIGSINFQLEKLRLHERRLQLDNQLTDADKQKLATERAALNKTYQGLEAQLGTLHQALMRDTLVVRDMRNQAVTIPFGNILDVSWPNDMSLLHKVGFWFHQIGKFVSDEPREANTEGGVFPAIFGTVFMVLLMTVIVTPLGVVAAVYLHEYAGKHMLTRLIRIAVINLAGVPSIVYGVFGLGFFVYVLGGTIDQLFYPEALPSPTVGSPGVLWSAITLAILTLPVVIVSTEEGLARIPSAVRHGSLALGATKAETLWRIVLPMASPAIMTGLILAIARAAGEVAPLMLVGAVKLAPTLPVDGNFPYLHVERKFMHLGFHIFDVGFQSPNVEAARPLVYATSFLLVTVIVGLNLTAISIRNHLREKFRALDN